MLSVAQIGNELRVLVAPDQAGAETGVADTVRGAGLAVEQCTLDTASLEDVFVAATRGETGG